MYVHIKFHLPGRPKEEKQVKTKAYCLNKMKNKTLTKTCAYLAL
jgi:hypothetical protein